MESNLTWGLIVITYNRVHFLVECLKHTLSQTRMPAEVVVVDASDNWEENYAKVKRMYADAWEQVRLVYEPAKVRGIPYQRNQALDASQADIVFSLDDDIYMEPDAAGIIMDAYEKDKEQKVAMIGGHFTSAPPGESAVDDEGLDEGAELKAPVAWVKHRLEQNLTLESHFVPYGKPIEWRDPPEPLQDTGLFPSGLLNGGRTTFRRCFGVKCRWSTLLRYYATHEDSDFSYRMSHHGQVLVAPKAGFFHADGAEARPDKFKVNTIRVRNLMALHRVSSSNRVKSALRLMCSFFYFVGLYMLIDPARKRFTLPNVRSYALGALSVPYFMFFPFADFRRWYVDQQEKMYRAR